MPYLISQGTFGFAKASSTVSKKQPFTFLCKRHDYMRLKPLSKKVIVIFSSLILLVCFICTGMFIYALWGGGGEPATLNVATRVSQEFIEYIHNGQIELAHSMISEKFDPPVTEDEFAALVRQDERIFKTYQKFEVCDWGFFISDGRVIDVSGLLYYEDGVVAVQISLHKDSDAVWRIQGFRFRPDIDPKPFGLCR